MSQIHGVSGKYFNQCHKDMAKSIIEHTSKFMNQTRKLTSSDDMDNLTQAGFYTQADNDLPVNAPGDNPNNAGIVVLKARDGIETIQIWFGVNSSSCWFRCKPAYSSWGSWHKVMVGGNFKVTLRGYDCLRWAA